MSERAGVGAPFEVRRFAAAAVSDRVAVVEVGGRLSLPRGRFARPPVLVVEPRDGERLELAPVDGTLSEGRWDGVYAVPVAALSGGRFALGLRGALVELPEPDVVADSDRLASLAREANALRRAVERAEAEADERVAAAQAEADERLAAAEAEAAAQVAAAEARAEERIAAAEARAGEADERVRAAEERTAAAERAAAATAADAEALRAELAAEHERARAAIAELQARLTLGSDPSRERNDSQAPEAESPEFSRTNAPNPHPLGSDPSREGSDPNGGEETVELEPAAVVARAPRTVHQATDPRLARWIALGLLALFVLVLLVLLFG